MNNFNAVNVVMFGVGAILIYSAIKDTSPKDVITNAFATSAASAKPAHTTTASTHTAPAGSHVRSDFAQHVVASPVVTSN